MRSLDELGRRQLVRRRGRSLLTATGTALGVAVLFAVIVTSGAAQGALDRALVAQAGEADVLIAPVGSYDGRLSDGIVERVVALDGVARVTPARQLRTIVTRPGDVRDPGSRNEITFVSGVDLSEPVVDLRLDRGRLPADGAAELAIASQLADRLDVEVGATVQVTTTTGVHDVEVVGVLAPDSAGLGFQGRIAFTSLAAAAALDGGEAGANSLAVVLAHGTASDRWIEANGPALADVSVDRAEDVASGFEDFIAGITTGLTLVSTIAVFVGGFLVFLTFSVSVAERTRTYGTLRALGAHPRQIRRVVLGEALVLGLAASVVGLALGYLLSKAAVGITGRLFGLSLGTGFPVATAVACLLVGVLVSLAAAWLPGRRAAAVGPLAAMREGSAAIEPPTRAWWRLSILAVAVVLGAFRSALGPRMVATLLLLLGAVLCVPLVLAPVAGLLGRLTRRAAGGVGQISVNHLVKERSRSAFTLGIVMVVLAMLIAVAGVNQSLTTTVDEQIDAQAGGLVQMGAPGAFEPGIEDELLDIEGVRAVSPIRFGRTEVSGPGAPPIVQDVAVIDPVSYFAMASFLWADGSDERVAAALAQPGSVVLPQPIADEVGVGLGDTVVLQTNGGPADFELVATYVAPGAAFGAVVSTADSARFGGGRPNVFLVQPEDGTDPEALDDVLVDELTGRYQLVVDTPESTRAFAHGQIAGFVSLSNAVLFLATIIGLLGLANTLAVSVLARTREIGILRSVGVRRKQVRRLVLVESLTLTLVAFVLALPLGALLTFGVSRVPPQQLGFSLTFVFPWAAVIVLGVLTLVVAVIASSVPARAAGRIQPVAALRFD